MKNQAKIVGLRLIDPLAVLVVLASLVFSGIILYQEFEARSALRLSQKHENELHLDEAARLVNAYFDSVYSTLLFVSLDENIRALRQDSKEMIQKLYEHQWRQHHLTEIYVVEKGFTGQQPPFMTFERPEANIEAREGHSLEREAAEYTTDIQMLQQFESSPTHEALLSSELKLCASDERGGNTRGFVYGVPIWSKTNHTFVGMVAGMFELETVRKCLHKLSKNRVGILVSESGHIIMDKSVPEILRNWVQEKGLDFLRSEQSEKTVSPKALEIDGFQILTEPVNIIAGEKWHMIMFFEERAMVRHSAVVGLPAHFALAGGMVFAGIYFSRLLRKLKNRLLDEINNLVERKKIEQLVHEAQETQQQQIGFNLQEDMCQRLTGLAAASRLLEKTLSVQSKVEAGLAQEISNEIKSALTIANQMANELRPVPVLENGLIAALRELADRTVAEHNIACRFDYQGSGASLDSIRATELYRITQQAIRRALAYLGLKTITINFREFNGRVSISIRHGGSARSEACLLVDGLLKIMKYRSELIGGEFTMRQNASGEILMACWLEVQQPSNPSQTSTALI